MAHNVLATALALTGYFIEYQLRNKYSIPLEAEFRDFNGKGGISLPELLEDFDAGIFCSLEVVPSGGFSVILGRNGALCTHYSYTVGYETTQHESY